MGDRMNALRRVIAWAVLVALKVRELLHAHGLEDRIKIIVGGAPYRFDHTLWQTVKADGWAENAVAAARLVEDMLSEVAR